MKFTGVHPQPAVEIVRKGKRSRLADANDAHILRADHADRKFWKLNLERNRRQKACATTANDKHAPEHSVLLTTRVALAGPTSAHIDCAATARGGLMACAAVLRLWPCVVHWARPVSSFEI